MIYLDILVVLKYRLVGAIVVIVVAIAKEKYLNCFYIKQYLVKHLLVVAKVVLVIVVIAKQNRSTL